jgi:putative phage-type endonuclease
MTLHVFEYEQRSEDWYAARRGVITASAVAKLLTPALKVADNDTSRRLTTQLAAERITGWTEETAMTPDMWRGVDHEPYARDKYAQHFAPVTDVGFMLYEADNWRLGYSPDGLVGVNGLLEIKCPRPKTHVATILADEVPAQYVAQCQAGLLVSGRPWIDFVSYVAGMPLYRKRVLPDPAWFDAIVAACVAFEANVAQIVALYQKRVRNLPPTERLDFEIKV